MNFLKVAKVLILIKKILSGVLSKLKRMLSERICPDHAFAAVYFSSTNLVVHRLVVHVSVLETLSESNALPEFKRLMSLTKPGH